MIKLADLLEAYVQMPGDKEPEELVQKGYKLSEPTINPETGASTTDVIKEFQPFKFSANEDVAKVSKDINTHLTKVSQLIFALDKMIELQRKG